MAKHLTRISLALGATALPLSHAYAGAAVDLPAPGILGLVALGVVGAIAVARHRK